jgi:hypothetical protein
MKYLFRIANPYSKTVWMTYPHRRCKFTAAVQIRNDWDLLLHKQNITVPIIDLSDQPKGIYYLKVLINNFSKYFKLILS